MRYLSDVTNKTYNTVEELEKAEAEAKQKDATRQQRAKECEDAIKAAHEARRKADELVNAFAKDYGKFIYNIHETEPINSFFDAFFNWI